MLVQEFEDDQGNKYNYNKAGAQWNGNYTWAPWKVGKTQTSLTHKVDAFVHKTNGEFIRPRLFQWQEMMGYSLKKQPGTEYPAGEPYVEGAKTIERAVFEYDGEGKRIPVGFDENFQHQSGKAPFIPVKNAFDTIMVRNKTTGVLEPHDSMNDFMFEKNFGVGEDGEAMIRQTYAFFVCYENLAWDTGDFGYIDFMFTVFIAPADAAEDPFNAKVIQGTSQQWWERDEVEGLTGNVAHSPISSNMAPGTENITDVFAANFNLLGHTPKEELESLTYSMIDAASLENTIFPRALFERDIDGISTGRLLKRLRDIYDSLDIKVYYYTENDLLDIILRDPLAYWDKDTGLDYDKALQVIVTANPGYDFQYIDKRWEPSNVDKAELIGLPEKSSYKVVSKDVSIRRLAADVIGYKIQAVPTVYTVDYERKTNGELELDGSFGDFPAPGKSELGFLAGEILHDQAEEELTAIGAIPHRDIVFDQPDGSQTPIRELLADDPADAVAMCYVDYYAGDPLTKEEVQKRYGRKDQRYSIGFRRSGPSDRYAAKHAQDHYEVVSLGVTAFNPYRETIDPAQDGRYVAREMHGVKAEDNVSFGYEFKYADDEGLTPNFVFDKPIDGAGTLVVNGNLVIEDDFAYHGILIVLGDIIIRPALKTDQYVYGKDGNPMDCYGNSLFLDGSNKWAYTWVSPRNSNDVRVTNVLLDHNGDPILEGGAPIRTDPLKESVYRGKLVTQGFVAVKGRVRTESVKDMLRSNGTDEYFVSGQMQMNWSRKAVEDTGKMWAKDKHTVNRVVWGSGENIDVEALWQDKLD